MTIVFSAGVSIKTIRMIILTLSFFSTVVFAQHGIAKPDSMVTKFYATVNKPLYWFQSSGNLFSSIGNWLWGNDIERVKQWLDILDSSGSYGISADTEKIRMIRAFAMSRTKSDSTAKAHSDTLFTDLVLHFIKDLQQGSCRFDYDEISINRDSLYISQLLNPRLLSSATNIVAALECKDPDYKIYKRYLNDSMQVLGILQQKTIMSAMNYRRFLSSNCQSEYIVVNIPQTGAGYYKDGKPSILMRVVAGKKTTQTPTIASYIARITTFPHWNVPYQVAVIEILPKVQKNENYLEQNNFTVVDADGNDVDDSELDWNNFDSTNFPYYFRQSSGSANALGVLKFNLQNPFSIFMHGTSNQKTFSQDYRFLSHGCIRLEKPFELADSLLRGKIDIKELEAGVTIKEPTILRLRNKIPVFIIYMPVQIDSGHVTFLKDEYALIK